MLLNVGSSQGLCEMACRKWGSVCVGGTSEVLVELCEGGPKVVSVICIPY